MISLSRTSGDPDASSPSEGDFSVFDNLSPNLRDVLRYGWSEKIKERWSIEDMNEILRDEVFNDSEMNDSMMDVSNRTQRSL